MKVKIHSILSYTLNTPLKKKKRKEEEEGLGEGDVESESKDRRSILA